MIDTQSSADILYLDTLLKIGYAQDELVPLTIALTGFTGDSI